MMFEKLDELERKYTEVENEIKNVGTDFNKYNKLMQDYKEMSNIVTEYRNYKDIYDHIKDDQNMLDDEKDNDMKILVEDDIKLLKNNLNSSKNKLMMLMVPEDKNDCKNVIIEIRAGAGGEEASLFSGVLFRMYSMYADIKKYKIDIITKNQTELGGFKQISFMVIGREAYSKFKYESGVHRVQRIPETESNGRIQTSTATVAVLPEADEVEIDINPNDLKIESCKSSGAGGQHINKTESAVRIIHIPTGIVTECQEERSQYKNKDKAMKMLRTKLFDIKNKERNDKISSERKLQIGTGDRSERIRTYNYPQSRITDHRINFTTHRMDEILNGNLDILIDPLATSEVTEKLKSIGE